MADLKSFAEHLVDLTSKEVNELAQILKEEYGIEAVNSATEKWPPVKNTDYLREQENLRQRGMKKDRRLSSVPKEKLQKFRRRK